MNQLPLPSRELPHTSPSPQQSLPTRMRPTYHGTAGPRPQAGGTPDHKAGRRPAQQTKEGQQP